ncbi:MAG: hypothetical protein OEX04_08395 [Acidimicrobiia bacterium]|nr:hypothetical protein [Acidimicrobiia bacterium]MDH4307487.1 hypothetical protein [Acidimicrobiia bacterium]MDH5293874.1 hypothetical protein [Acidimicrobiia bacterium]
MRTTHRLGAILGVIALMIPAVPAAAHKPHRDRSVSPVTFLSDSTRTVGWSSLVRDDDGVHMMFRSSELGANAAITIWWVVFNNPNGCSNPCGPDDLFLNGDPTQGFNEAQIEAAQIVAGYSTGRVANEDGKATFRDSLLAGAVGDELIVGSGPLIQDSRVAEIHVVARTHGPAIPGLVDEQLGSYAGGCEVFLLPGSDTGNAVGVCADFQSATHLP